MAKRKTEFSIVTQMKKESRSLIGSVPVTKLVPHKHKRAPRHKQTLAKLVEGQ